jgi:uncharacterized protein (UPF0332 family)
MKKQFATFGTLMAQAREALRETWIEQNNEIGAVNDEHRAMLNAYEQKQKDVQGVIKAFEIKLDEDLSYDDMLAEQQKSMREMERLTGEFEANWGKDLDAHEAKIAKIKAKYERMYQKTMKAAGYNLSVGNAE